MKDILLNRDPKLQVRVPAALRHRLTKYAEEHTNGNISSAIRRLVDQGLERYQTQTKKKK